MADKALLNLVLTDDSLTRGLGDAEARVLVEWLVDQVELHVPGEDLAARSQVLCLLARARAISRFVYLWCYARTPAGAYQLAATERLFAPLPTAEADPYDLMVSCLHRDLLSPERTAA